MLVLAVLKTILIVLLKLLLTLLGILLVLVLMVLLIPICYSVSGSFLDEVPDGKAEISWLYGGIRAEIEFLHGMAVAGGLRLFGFRIIEILEKDEEEAGICSEKEADAV